MIILFLEQAIGAMVVLLVLLDVFLTVLYARAKMGVISITTLAPALAYRMDEIDPAGNRPETADKRPAFHERLRSAG